ncbi:acyl-CoA dehydrogenase family protein [Methylorubrum extorquens]|uniref:acyl-CoA dehydrogenase family protein n=1 Tax=Methylorubrum extorquens TaxID=408 RepID=UPI000158F39B|nr:acyl-CoA dehydrogenase family protein [Methylorubrum extorquens]ABY29572.1 acyl-CoA dehydrogenase domain protein [Methylorubrum extorquens PA1]KQP88820.1 acyl-CoA dehydrogenase [Methylobacterium sp. Leaf119]WIU40895.1 acyl-CoA/acyl-ACP dehydrogenase [Methylorubrum extorquens]
MTMAAASLDTVRRLAENFASEAGERDRAGAFPHGPIACLREAGLIGLTVPERLGGGGAGLARAAQVVGTLGAGDPAVALVLAMTLLQHGLIHRDGTPWPRALADTVGRDAATKGALINALRVEPDLGTPARGGLPGTLARRDGDDWRVSGRKIYSTGAPGLAYGVVFVRTDEPEPRVGNLLVPMSSPGIRIEETWDHLGLRASGSHDVVFEDVRVPGDHAVDLRRPEEWRRPDPLQQAWSCTLLAALYDGVAQAAQAWFRHFLHERVPGSLGAPLASLPRFHEALGENERLLSVNARLVASLAAETDAGALPAPQEAGFVKLTVTENAIQAVQRVAEFCGNAALSRKAPLERHLRDVLCARIHWPQGDAVRIAAGRTALGV